MWQGGFLSLHSTVPTLSPRELCLWGSSRALAPDGAENGPDNAVLCAQYS